MTNHTVYATYDRLVEVFGKPVQVRDLGRMPEAKWWINTPHGSGATILNAVTGRPTDKAVDWCVFNASSAEEVDWIQGRINGNIVMNHEVELPKIMAQLSSGEVTLPEALKLAYDEGSSIGFSAGGQEAADESIDGIHAALTEVWNSERVHRDAGRTEIADELAKVGRSITYNTGVALF